MEVYFVLDERGEPLREPDVDAWQRWFEQADRGVARTTIAPDVAVLTTFRGVEVASEEGRAPRLFETRVFGGVLDGEEQLHATRGEALSSHASLAEWCRLGAREDLGFGDADLQ
jgi:hypothetical protein